MRRGEDPESLCTAQKLAAVEKERLGWMQPPWQSWRMNSQLLRG